MQYGYSAMMVNAGVALIYGPIFPVLYPLTCLLFLLHALVDRVLICYYYREPACYDERMSKESIVVMRHLPLVTLAITFW